MAKKAKKVKRKPRVKRMMVIRVSVPARYVPKMKVASVWGRAEGEVVFQQLQILSAYYDMPDQPNARSDS